ncbi:hypothetical protein G6O67_008413 [Ophiocordyceps sinensis]|uniref:Uncharacterized protein n=1 Tax=Ophiocordyceps sinensis TaxID=72228 RepID=A0A8H4LSF1_9HYPO|nr:hypothetical protein G6O67_008413 [Ophiocordyceps sinensis]
MVHAAVRRREVMASSVHSRRMDRESVLVRAHSARPGPVERLRLAFGQRRDGAVPRPFRKHALAKDDGQFRRKFCRGHRVCTRQNGVENGSALRRHRASGRRQAALQVALGDALNKRRPVVKGQQRLLLESAEIPCRLRSGLARRSDPANRRRRDKHAFSPEALAPPPGDFVLNGPSADRRLEAKPLGQRPKVAVTQGGDAHFVNGLFKDLHVLLQPVHHGDAVAGSIDAKLDDESREKVMQERNIAVKVEELEGAVVRHQVQEGKDLAPPLPWLTFAGRGVRHNTPAMQRFALGALGRLAAMGGQLAVCPRVGRRSLTVQPRHQRVHVGLPNEPIWLPQQPLRPRPHRHGNAVTGKVRVSATIRLGVRDDQNGLDDPQRRYPESLGRDVGARRRPCSRQIDSRRRCVPPAFVSVRLVPKGK